MRKLKTLLAIAVFAVFGTSAFAEDATVTFVSGKVEVQRDGKWIPLQKGDSVAKSETISTGFQSEVKIKVLDSVMYLGPVTRITLEELSSNGSQDNVNVYLKTGTARSQVKHVDNKRVNYQVHTAVAVASCRGTEWIIDDSNNVVGIEGTVAVSAYVPPVKNEEDAESGEEEKKEEEEKTSDSGEETDGASTTEGDVAAEGDGKTDTKQDVGNAVTSDDGVLVKADQTVSVSENNTVSAPVNNTVRNANNIKSTVGSAASKEAVGGGPAAAAESGKDDGMNNNPVFAEPPKRENKSETGSIEITIEF